MTMRISGFNVGLAAALFIAAFGFTAEFLPANAQYLAKDPAPSQTANSQYLVKDVVAGVAGEFKSNVVETGASCSTKSGQLGPDEAIVINGGIQTKGTVRVNTMAMLEAVLNIGANGAEMICFAWATGLLIAAFTTKARDRKSCVLKAIISVCIGLSLPGTLNWLVANSYESSLFS